MAIKNKINEVRSKQQEIRSILQDVSYKQVDNYIDKNVKDLKSAKAYLKKLSKVVLSLVKEED